MKGFYTERKQGPSTSPLLPALSQRLSYLPFSISVRGCPSFPVSLSPTFSDGRAVASVSHSWDLQAPIDVAVGEVTGGRPAQLKSSVAGALKRETV